MTSTPQAAADRPEVAPAEASARRDKPRAIKPRAIWIGACLLLSATGAWMLLAPARPDASAVSSGRAPARSEGALRVSSAVAGPGVMVRSVRVAGTLVARDEVSIGTALQDQRLAAIHADEGDAVAAGQVLARLETAGLEAQMRQSQAAVARARAAIAQQAAIHAEARASLLRMAPLGRSGAVSEQQIDERRAQEGAAAAGLDAARAEYDQARAQLAEARTQLGKADIRSPAAGIISERGARIGALSGSEPLFRLIRDGQVELDGEVPEHDLPWVSSGLPVRVDVAGIAMPVAGRVRLVAPKVDASTRLGRVRIALEPHPDLRAGAYASTRVEVDRPTIAVVVPQRAVSIDAQGVASVMLIGDGGRVTRRVIGAGRRSGDAVEVTSGLKAGDRVVAGASAFVRDGDEVRIARMPPGDTGQGQ